MHDTVMPLGIKQREPGRTPQLSNQPRQADQMNADSWEQDLPRHGSFLCPWSLQAGLALITTCMTDEHTKNDRQGSGFTVNRERRADTSEQLPPGRTHVPQGDSRSPILGIISFNRAILLSSQKA